MGLSVPGEGQGGGYFLNYDNCIEGSEIVQKRLSSKKIKSSSNAENKDHKTLKTSVESQQIFHPCSGAKTSVDFLRE